METVVLRLVGAATLVGQRDREGTKGREGGKVLGCVGGYGPVVGSVSEAADLLLALRPVRIPVGWEVVVRRVLAMRALAGKGTGGEGVNWG